MMTCGCRFDEDGDPDEVEGPFIDSNGMLAEVIDSGGQQVVVHYSEVPESDITTIDGIRVTTALRTVIDLATSVDVSERVSMVSTFLERGLFTVEEARDRVVAPDLATHPGAPLIKEVLDSLQT